ncbi:MAG: asparagine synthase (glutamine-hydrolyzing) [Myxococcaceae bacterium]|nr:asparagine synthase (glutamine-hydrolyzing) [Myxococcaceae bacterium]
MVSERPIDKRRFQRMLESLSHRGPDDEGVYETERVMLGIRRLSIVDVENGHQPQYNESGDLCIIFNGEIYNHRELRGEIGQKHHFRTESDTELILHAYEEWGEECVHRFNGMFVFAIKDGDRIFIARDRLGEKPLYYHHRDGLFVFASEAKAMLSVIETAPRIPESLLVFENLLDDETLFEGIHALPAASTLTYEDGKVHVRKYWDIHITPDYSLSEGFCIEKLRWLMQDAVRLRIPQSMPFGCLLSGGIDSSIVACLARPEHVFICHFPYGEQYDELHYAELVADHVGARKHIIRPDDEDFREFFPWVVYMLDQPVGTAAAIAEFLLNREASQHVKVVLNGLGLDEFFAGYIRHLLMALEETIVQTPALKNYSSLAQYFWNQQMFTPLHERYFHLIQRGASKTEGPLRRVQECFARFRDVLNQVSYTDACISLPGLLTLTDRASSAFGIEARSPFLDYRIVEFSYQIPPQLKLKGDQTKYLVRKAAEGLIPQAILDRKEKMGFVVPVNHWFSGRLRSWSEELMEKLKRRGGVHAIPESSERGEFDRSRYQSVSLELWYEQFFS